VSDAWLAVAGQLQALAHMMLIGRAVQSEHSWLADIPLHIYLPVA